MCAGMEHQQRGKWGRGHLQRPGQPTALMRWSIQAFLHVDVKTCTCTRRPCAGFLSIAKLASVRLAYQIVVSVSFSDNVLLRLSELRHTAQ